MKPADMKSGSGFSKEEDLGSSTTNSPSMLSASTLSSLSDVFRNSQSAMNAMKLGLLGMVIGTTYGLIKGEAENRSILINLDPQPEAFGMEPLAPILFNRLGKYRYLHEEAYRKAVLFTDQIFMREREIARSRKPVDSDYPMIESLVEGVLGYIILMRERSKTGEERAAVENLKMEITEVLKDHRSNVYHLCASTRLT
jgi:hypothetical protein